MDLQITAILSRLSGRERVMVVLSGGLLLLFILHGLFWSPLFEEMERLSVKVREDKQALLWMQVSVEQWQQLSGKLRSEKMGGLSKGTSLLGVVDSTVMRFQLKESLRRIEPDGNNGVKLSYEGVLFDSLVKWLGMLEKKYGVKVVRMNLSADESLGRVSARISLQIERV